MRPGHPDPWIHPATPGLPQVACKAGEDCLMQSPRLIVAVTATQGFCASCAQRRGLSGNDKQCDTRAEQLSLLPLAT